ncbi:MAG: hypothetical protein B0D92_01340 [Spirochaeta sp. LUC14_002_19_P3]|nr:MAG: hypothetical protein B0D92_01340 [Spirochaeta sp. LUC14_002_19_P3]
MMQIINVRVIPKAKIQTVKKELHEDGILYRVYVTAPAQDGRANKAAIELLAHEMGVAKSKISIISGQHSRSKKIRIDPWKTKISPPSTRRYG